jgi:hypothetical protein
MTSLAITQGWALSRKQNYVPQIPLGQLHKYLPRHVASAGFSFVYLHETRQILGISLSVHKCGILSYIDNKLKQVHTGKTQFKTGHMPLKKTNAHYRELWIGFRPSNIYAMINIGYIYIHIHIHIECIGLQKVTTPFYCAAV